MLRRPAVLLLLLAAACGGSVATESETADELSASYKVTRTSPAPEGDQSAPLALRVTGRDGKAVTRFQVEHTKLFHLILVSGDLSYFAHVHPAYDTDGRFEVTWKPPAFDDGYEIYSQFKPAGRALQTVHGKLHVNGLSMKTPVPAVPDTDSSKSDGRNVLVLSRPREGLHAGKEMLHFQVRDARTGKPAEDLGTFLGAKAHLIAVRANANGRTFIHAHDMGEMQMPGMNMTEAPSELSFEVNFPEPGVYRVWVQYSRNGDVTQFFTLRVLE